MDDASWNIHGRIAFPLELIARNLLQKDEAEIRNTFLSADAIEGGTFVEAMLYLLRCKNGLEHKYSSFAQVAQPLFGKPLTVSDKEKINDIYMNFQELIEYN